MLWKAEPRAVWLGVAWIVSEREWRWALLGLCLLAFVLRVHGLEYQSLWRDEVDAIRFASRSTEELLRTFVTPGENGPFYYLVLSPWLTVAGRSEFSLRFLSLAFGVLAVPLVHRLARRLFPWARLLAFIAVLLVATSPYLVWYSQEGKMYTLVTLLVLVSMDRFLAAVDQGGVWRWLGYVVATSLAFYVHLLAVLIVPVQVVVFLIRSRPLSQARWWPWLASTAALTVPYVPLLAWQVPSLLNPGETGFQFLPLHQILFSLLGSYSLGIVPGVSVWILTLFIGVLLAVGLLGLERASWRVPLIILFSWLLLPILGLFLITLVRPLFTARYLIYVLPAYLLLLAAGIVILRRRAPLVAGLVLIAILSVNAWGLRREANTPLKADFRGATRYVTSRLVAGDVVLFQIPYGRYSFEYYALQRPGRSRQAGAHRWQTPSARGQGEHRILLPLLADSGGMPYRWAEGLYTNAGMDLAEVDRHMVELAGSTRVVWLVATEAGMWDERNLVQTWLDTHAVRTEEAQFVRVEVIRYELP